jgi:hypothetical protein
MGNATSTYFILPTPEQVVAAMPSDGTIVMDQVNGKVRGVYNIKTDSAPVACLSVRREDKPEVDMGALQYLLQIIATDPRPIHIKFLCQNNNEHLKSLMFLQDWMNKRPPPVFESEEKKAEPSGSQPAQPLESRIGGFIVQPNNRGYDVQSAEVGGYIVETNETL